MKIFVCITKTPDTTAKISFSHNSSKLNEDGLQYIVNPYDEWYALGKAVELSEKNGGEVIILNVGDASNDPLIRKCFALGANRAIRIDKESNDTFEIASELENIIKNQDFDLIIGGKETISYGNASVLGILAGLLNIPFIPNCSKLDFENNTFKIEQIIQGGIAKYETSSKFILTATKGLSEQKNPSMKNILGAKTKQIEVKQPSITNSLTQIINYELPPEKKGCKIVENTDELVNLLINEAKVLHF